jgi:DNA invertase Pin-like site-specific DNA recombinase
MAKVFAYLRVSQNTQTTENQRKEIIDAGYHVTEWFSDNGVSGTVPQKERKMFAEMISKTEPGTIIVMTKLDRLGRDASDALETMKELRKLKLKVIVLQLGAMDITSPAGKLMCAMLSAVAEMEMDLLKERIFSGLARAKEQGVVMGAPTKIKPEVLKQICLAKAHGKSLDDIQHEYGVDRSTASRNIRRWKDNLDGYAVEYNKRVEQIATKALRG